MLQQVSTEGTSASAFILASEETFNLDVAIWSWLQKLSSEDDPWAPAATEIVRDVTALGSNVVLLMLVVAVSGYLILKKNRSLAVWLVVMAGSAVLLNHGLKEFIDRARPDELFQAARVFTPSFPSAHAMLSAAVYSAIVTVVAAKLPSRMNLYFWGIAGLLILFIGLSRLYLGVHWFTDVVGGWLIGLAWTWLAWQAYRKIYVERQRGKSGSREGAGNETVRSESARSESESERITSSIN